MDNCQICMSVLKKIHANLFEKCLTCKTIFYLKAKNIHYGEKYFLKEYKNQYGKSYFSDKVNLQKKMQWRMDHFFQRVNLQEQFPNEKICLLEVGSAAGFFLELMPKYNIIAEGWEFSSFMSRHAKNNGLNSIAGDFFSIYSPQSHSQKFHIIASFYCIEHIANQKKLWEAFYAILKPKGFLLISIPSYFGPLFYFHYKKWIMSHPMDHFVDYSLHSLKKVALKFQFRFIQAFSEGLHPERFPLGNHAALQPIYKFFQKKFCFSDTIFIILQKK